MFVYMYELLSDEGKLHFKVRYKQQMMLLYGCRGAAFCHGAWTGFDGLR